MRLILLGFLTAVCAWAQSGAAQVTYKPTGATTNVSVQAALRANTIIPQSFGAVCNGITNDTPAFQRAHDAANPGDTIQVYSATNTGCVIGSPGLMITKPLTISAGAAGFPTAQLIAGSAGTMVTVSGTSGVNIKNLAFSPGSQSAATAIAIVNSTLITIDGNQIVGGFVDALTINFSFFTMISNNRFRLNLESVNGSNSPNSTTLFNNTFFMGVPGHDTAVVLHNGNQGNLISNTFECASTVTFFNWYAAYVHGNYFESQVATPCDDLSTVGYVGLGAPFSDSPVFGASVVDNLFNGNGGYGVSVGDVTGLDMSGNAFQGTAGALTVSSFSGFQQAISSCTNANPIVCTVPTLPGTPFYNLPHTVALSGFTGGWASANGNFPATQTVSGSTTFSIPLDGTGFGSIAGTCSSSSPTGGVGCASLFPTNQYHLGENNYGTLTPSQYVAFNGGYIGTSADDPSFLQSQPIQLSGSMKTPVSGQLPKVGNSMLYWGDVSGQGPVDLGSQLQMLTNLGNGSYDRTFHVRDLNCVVTAQSDSCNAQNILIQAYNNVATDIAEATFRNTHDSYVGTENSAGSGMLTSGGVAYSTVVTSNDNLPVIIGVGRTAAVKISAAPGSASSVVCWKADGLSLGHATVAEITSGTCH